MRGRTRNVGCASVDGEAEAISQKDTPTGRTITLQDVCEKWNKGKRTKRQAECPEKKLHRCSFSMALVSEPAFVCQSCVSLWRIQAVAENAGARFGDRHYGYGYHL